MVSIISISNAHELNSKAGIRTRGPLGGRRERYLCARQPPDFFVILKNTDETTYHRVVIG